MSQDYESKVGEYFADVRTQIEPLLPATAPRVLEIGCGTGATLRWLKANGRVQQSYGIELCEPVAAQARQHVDEVIVGDAERLIDDVFPGMQFDLILCLDVLEHMIDPWRFIEKLQRLLAPGGSLICSIPNVRSLKVVLPLMFLGRWRYESAGILDRTHLRFFARQSAMDLASTSGLEVQKWLRIMYPSSSKMGRLHRFTLGLFPDLMTKQYVIASGRPSGAAKRTPAIEAPQLVPA
jgi:2-polyprenyl-3-methyl-5-hydroxy-6-metoxy-1,4-benzoquinol methylase